MSQDAQTTVGETGRCPKCRENIQPLAKKCKHCGADLRNWFIRHKVITAFLVVFAIGIIASSGGSDKGPEGSTSASSTVSALTDTNKATEPRVIKITASQLYSEYEENEIAADTAYKKQILEVSGTLGTIAKDVLDSPYVTLKTGNIIGSIQCYLKETEVSKAASLKSGTNITVRGEGGGKLGNVLVRKCEIVK